MFAKPLLTTSLALAAACSLWTGSAQAATYTLELNGIVDDFSYFPQEAPPVHLDRFYLDLQGLGSSNTIDLSVGDFIEATVTFDRLLNIPASVAYTNFSLFLTGNDFPDVNTAAQANFTFFDENGFEVKTYISPVRTTSNQIAAIAAFAPPENGAFQFKSFKSVIEITDLSQTATLDRSYILYDLASPAAIPEPGTWAMMIVGFGGVGALMRRDRRERGISAFA